MTLQSWGIGHRVVWQTGTDVSEQPTCLPNYTVTPQNTVTDFNEIRPNCGNPNYHTCFIPEMATTWFAHVTGCGSHKLSVTNISVNFS